MPASQLLSSIPLLVSSMSKKREKEKREERREKKGEGKAIRERVLSERTVNPYQRDFLLFLNPVFAKGMFSNNYRKELPKLYIFHSSNSKRRHWIENQGKYFNRAAFAL